MQQIPHLQPNQLSQPVAIGVATLLHLGVMWAPMPASPPPAPPKPPQVVTLVDAPPIAKPPIAKPKAPPQSVRSATVPLSPVRTPVMPPTGIAPVIATQSQQISPAPAQNPPAQNPPVQNPPVQNPPVQNPPVQNPPVQNPPVQNPPVQNPPTPTTTGGVVLNQAGGQPCGLQCNDLPLTFATQDFLQQIQQTSQKPVQEIRDRDEGYFMGWVVAGANGQNEYWYYRQLPGPTNRYYQLAARYETQAELSQAIAQLPVP